MASSFIPSFHFAPPESKLTKEWCWEAITNCYYHTNNVNLLQGKNLEEIEGFATGNFNMSRFKKIFKSIAKKELQNQQNNNNRFDTRSVGEHEIGFVPLPLIPEKLNSAVSLIQKIPIDITVTAQDPLAIQKKNSDLTFLKNKPAIEQQVQQIADQMQLGKVDLGKTKNSAIPFSDSPYGLDLNEPDELQVFVDILYTLAVEAGFETLNQEWWEIKNGKQIKLLEIKDQFKLGVSVNRTFASTITNMPDIEYVYPGSMETPKSQLPDYSDNTHRLEYDRLSVMDVFNNFGDEIGSLEDLQNIIVAKGTGYCACNGIKDVPDMRDINNYKVEMVYCEIKSVDYVMVSPLNKKSKFTTVVDEDDSDTLKTTSKKVWGQNTYCFWWLKGTKYFYKIDRLGFATRKEGQESYSNFSTNIYKSQEKSAVELSIGENIKAQVADIKMQYAILKALPAGMYIDLKFLRGALNGLKEGKDAYTIENLINNAMESNIIIGDTQGFDGKNDGQLKAFEAIPGGIKSELVGYLQVIADANQKISQFTGINENLIGQKAEELVRNNQALINAGINALQYVNEGIELQYQKMFTAWSTIFQAGVKNGGKTKEAIISLIGAKKVSLIDSLNDLPLHKIGVKVSISRDEQSEQKFQLELNRLKINNVINTIDEYMLSAVTNAKDRMALLAVKFKQWQRRTDLEKQQQFAQQQQMLAAQGQNQVAAVNAKVQGDIQKIYATGDTSARTLQLAAQLGIQAEQMQFIGKKSLQQDRGQDQTNKAIAAIQTKAEVENQAAYQ